MHIQRTLLRVLAVMNLLYAGLWVLGLFIITDERDLTRSEAVATSFMLCMVLLTAYALFHITNCHGCAVRSGPPVKNVYDYVQIKNRLDTQEPPQPPGAA